MGSFQKIERHDPIYIFKKVYHLLNSLVLHGFLFYLKLFEIYPQKEPVFFVCFSTHKHENKGMLLLLYNQIFVSLSVGVFDSL